MIETYSILESKTIEGKKIHYEKKGAGQGCMNVQRDPLNARFVQSHSVLLISSSFVVILLHVHIQVFKEHFRIHSGEGPFIYYFL